MWLKERDARKKICPLLRPDIEMQKDTRDQNYPPIERYRVERHSLCEASDCMAWRWGAEGSKNPPPRGPKDTEAMGFCGEFGLPLNIHEGTGL